MRVVRLGIRGKAKRFGATVINSVFHEIVVQGLDVGFVNHKVRCHVQRLLCVQTDLFRKHWVVVIVGGLLLLLLLLSLRTIRANVSGLVVYIV